MAVGLLTLLHVLVLVYWLGGDLGAFYGSTFLTDARRTVAERTMALTILNGVDMAPRSALILALPSGLALACAKGWLELPAAVPWAVAAASLGWLALAWGVHRAHGGAERLRRIDIAVRWGVLVLLAGLGLAGLAGAAALPRFVALKLIVLAACVALGLVVRRQLVPLFPAVRALIADGASPDGDAVIAGVIARTRPVVVTLWLLLLAAAWLGITTPV